MGRTDIDHLKTMLDALYADKNSNYYERLQFAKDLGYKVFRNSEGKHLVEDNSDYLKEAFGGIFRNI